jgi:hypothetical protein
MIHSLIERWLAGPDLLEIAPMVQASRALPVYSDMSGQILFIREDGEILVYRDNFQPPEVETQPEWRMIALTQGALKFPELRELLPDRDASARDCPACDGRGRIARGLSYLGCWECRGLGWVNEAV